MIINMIIMVDHYHYHNHHHHYCCCYYCAHGRWQPPLVYKLLLCEKLNCDF